MYANALFFSPLFYCGPHTHTHTPSQSAQPALATEKTQQGVEGCLCNEPLLSWQFSGFMRTCMRMMGWDLNEGDTMVYISHQDRTISLWHPLQDAPCRRGRNLKSLVLARKCKKSCRGLFRQLCVCVQVWLLRELFDSCCLLQLNASCS